MGTHPKPQLLLTSLKFGESPRWHSGRLWVSDWGTRGLIAVSLEGKSEVMALVTPDGSVRRVATNFAFPNGMVITPDNSTLVIAESHGKQLTAFDIAIDGNLSNRRVWANLGDGVPDGICLDAEGAVWYADVPNKRCVRVREGGEVLQIIALDRGCFACMLGGSDRKMLFMVTREWHGMESAADETRTGQVLTIEASAAGAGWP
jgi:sugar lactone lactonase YvrE